MRHGQNIMNRFFVSAIVITCFRLSDGDERRAVHFFSVQSLLSHHNLTAADFSPSAISRFMSSPSTKSQVDCSSLVSQYISVFAKDGAENKDLQQTCATVTACQSPDSLQKVLSIISGNERRVPIRDAVTDLCPLLLSHKLKTECPDSAILSIAGNEGKSSPLVVWGMAFLCVTIISLTSLIGVVIVPFLNKSSYINVLNLFEGLAVGSLVGSAIFHLIPQSFDLHSSPNKQQYLWKAFVIFLGIYMFYWSERIMNIISSSGKSSELPETSTDPKRGTEPPHGPQATMEQRLRTVSDVIAADQTHGHDHVHLTAGRDKIATVAWMIIFGDGLHNFIDGLSIGAAFNDSVLTGISICVAVVCEEFPHELGDFAVLIASGMSVRQAVGYNFLSACTCYMGMVIGVFAGNFGPTYIFALAGGMFLYIALVNMMGELTAAVETASKQSVRQTVKVLCLQNVGILTGIICLFLLAKYSEFIQFG